MRWWNEQHGFSFTCTQLKSFRLTSARDVENEFNTSLVVSCCYKLAWFAISQLIVSSRRNIKKTPLTFTFSLVSSSSPVMVSNLYLTLPERPQLISKRTHHVTVCWLERMRTSSVSYQPPAWEVERIFRSGVYGRDEMFVSEVFSTVLSFYTAKSSF